MKKYLLLLTAAFLSFGVPYANATFSNAPAPLTLPFTHDGVTYTDMLAWNSIEGFTYFWYYAAPTYKMQRIDTTSNNIKSWATGQGGVYAYMSRVSYRPTGAILSNWYWNYQLINDAGNYFSITGNGGPKEFTDEYIYTTQPIYNLDDSLRFDTNWIKWSIIINPLSGGEVTGENVSCNVDTSSICKFNNLKGVSKTLTAAPKSSNYAFSSWKINGGAEITDNPLTLALDGNKSVEAVFHPILGFPLSGTLESRTITMGFGDDWSFGQCPIGTDKLHSGIDIRTTANETVKVAADGMIKLIFEDTSQYQWGWCMVIEHDGSYTTTYWHMNDPRNAQIYIGATITKGQSIGTVKDMLTNTHLHFGVRMHAYTSDNIPNAGALPQSTCGTPSYPAFKEYFIDPSTLTYE